MSRWYGCDHVTATQYCQGQRNQYQGQCTLVLRSLESLESWLRISILQGPEHNPHRRVCRFSIAPRTFASHPPRVLCAAQSDHRPSASTNPAVRPGLVIISGFADVFRCTAVARGAILRAVRKEEGPARILQSSYGFQRRELYNEEIPAHREGKQRKDKFDEQIYINKTIMWSLVKVCSESSQ
jgi:hypothetical protein